MNAQNLAGAILGDEQRIVGAIQTGAQWEVWMQVELAILLMSNGVQCAREAPYVPATFPATHLDCLAWDGQTRFPIEMKVESATNAGRALIAAVLKDQVKLRGYVDPTVPLTRWVLSIAYSGVAKAALGQMAADPTYNAAAFDGQTIRLLIMTV
jgi:hypothetical protein